jgi:hypothetical protein
MVGVFVFERWVGMEIGFGEGKRERIILIIIIGGRCACVCMKNERKEYFLKKIWTWRYGRDLAHSVVCNIAELKHRGIADMTREESMKEMRKKYQTNQPSSFHCARSHYLLKWGESVLVGRAMKEV